ncbi:lipopolysaccharide biosynthesis protein [Microbacterium sp. SYP-A9085]|uniref:lipopolysaccharide biosynthesis protein n=1 Tax=Microbacterium sp. SYP-A9085 TaxID=2664454 RepID=UPI00156249A2|nr:lipopolysaccharide biosynthesis protein [Microbacterium sp. SYP-A9085]
MVTNLASHAARGATFTIALQATKFSIQLVGLVILARILPPSVFGLVAMVTAVVGVADVLRDFGLSSAAVQLRELSAKQASNLFWINSTLGLFLAALTAAAAPLLVSLYGDPRLLEIAVAISLVFAFNGAQTQFQAHLTRQMHYRTLALTDLGAQAVALIVAIGAAWWGAGYWAIVLQLISQSFSLLVFRFSTSDWRPGLPARSADVRPALRYGRNLAGTQLLVYASANLDSVLVGARFNETQLGLYSRAYQLLVLPIGQILSPLTAVALPVLSRLQDDRKRFVAYLLRAQTLVVYLTTSLFATSATCATYAIPLILGTAWSESAFIFQILAVGGAFQAVNYVTYWVYISLGLTPQHLRYTLTTRSLLIILMVAGSFFSPAGVAAGFSAGMALAWPISLMWVRRSAHIPIRGLASVGIRGITMGVVGATVGMLAGYMTAHAGDLTQLIVSALACVVSMAVITLTFPTGRRDIREIALTVSLLRHRKAGRE